MSLLHLSSVPFTFGLFSFFILHSTFYILYSTLYILHSKFNRLYPLTSSISSKNPGYDLFTAWAS
ncbi:MAG: hypothetical protein EA361_01720 [Bacteroidetes bacterium]|nr:MAG: hypothetical protein EA361_01720 [Bacteroidota bacterium]